RGDRRGRRRVRAVPGVVREPGEDPGARAARRAAGDRRGGPARRRRRDPDRRPAGHPGRAAGDHLPHARPAGRRGGGPRRTAGGLRRRGRLLPRPRRGHRPAAAAAHHPRRRSRRLGRRGARTALGRRGDERAAAHRRRAQRPGQRAGRARRARALPPAPAAGPPAGRRRLLRRVPGAGTGLREGTPRMTTGSAPAATAEAHGGGHGGGGHGGGTTAIVAALLANLGIAVAKFVAFFVTGASSMLAEGIHSVADSGNQVLLLFGGKRAKREATPEHPFGFGRERYIYAFIVSIILFSVGGLFALFEAYEKFKDPHGLEGPWWWVPLAVLVGAIIAE